MLVHTPCIILYVMECMVSLCMCVLYHMQPLIYDISCPKNARCDGTHHGLVVSGLSAGSVQSFAGAYSVQLLILRALLQAYLRRQ